jgi:hypothetical protein
MSEENGKIVGEKLDVNVDMREHLENAPFVIHPTSSLMRDQEYVKATIDFIDKFALSDVSNMDTWKVVDNSLLGKVKKVFAREKVDGEGYQNVRPELSALRERLLGNNQDKEGWLELDSMEARVRGLTNWQMSEVLKIQNRLIQGKGMLLGKDLVNQRNDMVDLAKQISVDPKQRLSFAIMTLDYVAEAVMKLRESGHEQQALELMRDARNKYGQRGYENLMKLWWIKDKFPDKSLDVMQRNERVLRKDAGEMAWNLVGTIVDPESLMETPPVAEDAILDSIKQIRYRDKHG